MTNPIHLATTNPSNLAQRVADIYLASELKASEEKTVAKQPEVITLPDEQLKDKVGLYRFAVSGEVRRITLRDGKLRIDSFGPSTELLPVEANRLRVNVPNANVELTFEKAANGKLSLKLPRNNKVDSFESVEAFAPTANQLAEFVGSYYAEELDTTYRFVVEDSKLTLINRNDEKRALTPTFRDAFIGGAQLEFSRDAQSRINGFVVQAGRIRHVKFVRR